MIKLMMALSLLLNIGKLSAKEDQGLVKAIKVSNINQLVPRPRLQIKASYSFKEAVLCEKHPIDKDLLVTLNPKSWYAMNEQEQMKAFCEEMSRCDSRIKCKKI